MNARRALVIGNSRYADGIRQLDICEKDARFISLLLRHHGIEKQRDDGEVEQPSDGEVSYVPNFDVSEYHNLDAAAMQKEIDDLFAGKGDIALLYFSGHGCMKWFGTGIVGSDGNSISLEDIMHRANASSYRNRIIILDSCYSGAAGNTGLSSGTAAHSISYIASGVSVLCACRELEQAVFSHDAQYSYFTSMLIDALDGRAATLDGFISLGTIYAYIDRNMTWNAQRPVFKTNVDGFCFLRRVQPTVSEEELRRVLDYFPDEGGEIALDPSYEFTNTDTWDFKPIEPYANAENVKKFKDLQKLVSAGLVEPVGEQHMYFAAMKSKSCRLTRTGKVYWQLMRNKPLPPSMPFFRILG